MGGSINFNDALAARQAARAQRRERAARERMQLAQEAQRREAMLAWRPAIRLAGDSAAGRPSSAPSHPPVTGVGAIALRLHAAHDLLSAIDKAHTQTAAMQRASRRLRNLQRRQSGAIQKTHHTH